MASVAELPETSVFAYATAVIAVKTIASITMVLNLFILSVSMTVIIL
jgi:hypothetical protein